MKVIRTGLADILLLEPRIFEDHRGVVFESYNRRDFQAATGIAAEFVQDNHSFSKQGVIRGMHYQVGRPQGKLIRVLQGEVFDVAIDLRRSSPTFKQWVGVTLSDANRLMLWIPPGFAHGLLTLSGTANVLYKMTEFWSPEHERVLLWSDPEIGIRWPLHATPILSSKDAAARPLGEAEVYA
jgi:dTDP-4-dehydrorhamnose 3,5-epimerase